MVNNFTEVYNENTHGIETFLFIISCIRSYLSVKRKVDIKSFALRRKVIKKTEKHIKRKASIFTVEEMTKVLIEIYNYDDPQDYLKNIVYVF